MLRWAAIFLVVAIIAAAFAFGEAPAAHTGLFNIMFALFLMLFVGSLLWASTLNKHRE
jgi:uncharacterized membrane protein YtjA (UPF0391 family)